MSSSLHFQLCLWLKLLYKVTGIAFKLYVLLVHALLGIGKRGFPHSETLYAEDKYVIH